MNNKKIQTINIIIILLEIIGLLLSFNTLNINTFTYYTTDSNILLFVSSTILLYYLLKKKKISKNLIILRYTSAVSVMLTFIIVITVLSWNVEGGLVHILFDGSLLYLHTLCPILALISFTSLENYSLDKRDVIKSTLFTLIYAFIMIVLNIFNIVLGPYPFLMVTHQPVYVSIMWIVLIYIIVLVISYTLKKLQKKMNG